MSVREFLSGVIVSAGVSLTISYFVISSNSSQTLEEMKTLQEVVASTQQKIAALERQLAKATSTENQHQPVLSQSTDKSVTPLKSSPEKPHEQTTVTSGSALVEKNPLVFRTIEQQLLSGGISNTDVESIVSTKRQIQESRLEQTWQYRRQAYLDQPDSFQLEAVNPLRARLGDELYEKYLKARDRRVAVKVSGVMRQSAADYAGILVGDEITHYDGNRVFHLNELSTFSTRYDLGEFVNVEILRDGQQLAVTIASGPLGVSMVGD